MDPDSSRLHVTVTDGRGRRIRDEGLSRWLAAVAPAAVRGEVAVGLVSDTRVRALNRRYRRKDSPTDVLSFGDSRSGRGRSRPEVRGPKPEARFWGDIVIATGVARRQARERQHAYRTELRVLALHGLLHLLGYDHDDPGDRVTMARVEARLRRKGGLREGLMDREAAVGPEQAASARRGKRLRPERGATSPSENARGWGPARTER